ncbi:hypothetical protein D3C72_1096770 [compost metagenome]
MHFRRKGFEAVRTVITGRLKRPDLGDIFQAIAAIHQHTVGVQHIGDGDGGVGYAGNMHEAGTFGEEHRLARKMVVEGVVHQPVDITAACRVDGLDGLGLGAQRRDRKTERLDKAGQSTFLKDRLHGLQRRDEIVKRHRRAVVERAHDQRLRTACRCIVRHGNSPCR